MIPNLDRGFRLSIRRVVISPKCTKLTIDGKPIAAIMRGKKAANVSNTKMGF